jgi:replicative DNA helicase
LGGLMLDNRAWDQIADKLVEKHFYRRDHQLIFRAMAKLTEENKPIDVITVSETLQKMEDQEPGSNLAYLGELAKNTPSAANIGAYADIVYERSILRELISVGTNITESAFDPQGRASSEILDDAEKKVFDIAERGVRGSGPEAIRTIVSKTLDNIEKRFQDFRYKKREIKCYFPYFGI